MLTEKIAVFSKINQWEEWSYFTLLQISLRPALIENSWILTSISAFNLLFYVVLAEVSKENPNPHSNARTGVGTSKAPLGQKI